MLGSGSWVLQRNGCVRPVATMVKILTFTATAGVWFLGLMVWGNYSRGSSTTSALKSVQVRLVDLMLCRCQRGFCACFPSIRDAVACSSLCVAPCAAAAFTRSSGAPLSPRQPLTPRFRRLASVMCVLCVHRGLSPTG